MTERRLDKSVLLTSSRRFKTSLMAATLDEAGFDVVTALGARAAIEIAGRTAFDAFLVDLDGLAGTARFLAIELKAVDPCAQLIGLGENRWGAPCDVLLGAPFSPAALVELVLASLGLAELRPGQRALTSA
jgi:hypothetical protein